MFKYIILILGLISMSLVEASTWFPHEVGTGKDAQNEYKVTAQRQPDGTFEMEIQQKIAPKRKGEFTVWRPKANIKFPNAEAFEKALQEGNVKDGNKTYQFKMTGDIAGIQKTLKYTPEDLKEEDISNYEANKRKMISDYEDKVRKEYGPILSPKEENEVQAKVDDYKKFLDDMDKNSPPAGLTVDQKMREDKEKALRARGYFEAMSLPVSELFKEFSCDWVDEVGEKSQAMVLETDSCGRKDQQMCTGTIRCTGTKVIGRNFKNYLTGERSLVRDEMMADHVNESLVGKGMKKDNKGQLYFQTQGGGVVCKADPKLGCDASACLNATGAINLKRDKIEDLNKKSQDGFLQMKDKGVK